MPQSTPADVNHHLYMLKSPPHDRSVSNPRPDLAFCSISPYRCRPSSWKWNVDCQILVVRFYRIFSPPPDIAAFPRTTFLGMPLSCLPLYTLSLHSLCSLLSCSFLSSGSVPSSGGKGCGRLLSLSFPHSVTMGPSGKVRVARYVLVPPLVPPLFPVHSNSRV